MLLLFTLALAAEPAQIASRDGAHLQRPQFSADGSRLSYEANFQDKGVVETWVGKPGSFTPIAPRSASTSLTAGFATRTAVAATHELAWSPTGTYAFSSTGSERDYDLYLEGGTPIAPGPGTDGGAAFSPDGSQLVFTSARTGEGDLYLLAAADLAAPPRRLTTSTQTAEVYATWHPGGKGLAWVQHADDGDHIYWAPSLGDDPLQVTEDKGSQTRPRFSPDGRWLAYYQSRADGGLDLMAVEPGSKPFALAERVVPDSSGPSWLSPSEVVFVLDNDEAFDPIAVVDVSSPDTTRALDLPTVGHTDLAVSGGKLAYVAQGREGDARRDWRKLYLVELD
ncbi:MAG: hypothetical protein EP330_11755 [Deltaproteobacteria bacterium]|nr:MAG: hypothetical protein EP330_11755 [Deltaproteobacteria bacterium]